MQGSETGIIIKYWMYPPHRVDLALLGPKTDMAITQLSFTEFNNHDLFSSSFEAEVTYLSAALTQDSWGMLLKSFNPFSVL